MQKEMKLKVILKNEQSFRPVYGINFATLEAMVLIGGCCYEWHKYKTVIEYTGMNLDDQPLFRGDVIQFKYYDNMEPSGFGICEGVIEFENGCYVVKHPDFKYSEDSPPDTLYRWLKDEKCEKVGNVFNK